MRFSSSPSVRRPRLSIVSAWLVGLLAVCMVAACGGGGGSSSSSNSTASTSAATSTIASAASNVLTINVQQGPEAGLINPPFVTITVCAPNTSTCDTVNNVILDTGSVGLRVLASAVPNSLSALSRIQLASNPSNPYLAVCGQFLSGYTWGSGRLADIKMSGESASSVPIQVIADSSVGSAPSMCAAGSSNNYSTAAQMGGNAILGVEGLILDCGASCVTAATSLYWGCSSATACSSPSQTAVPASQQLTNPVSKFATNNNGVIIEMPVISDSGAATATGALVFGVGTQSNNAVGSATVLQTDSAFNFKSTYNGTTNSSAFVDTGSNIYYLDDSIATCTASGLSNWFCPSSTVTRSVTFSSNVSGSTGTYATSIDIANASTTIGSKNYYAYNNLGYKQSGTMDFGMPFFYGKNVFVKMETVTGRADGYLAFISNVN